MHDEAVKTERSPRGWTRVLSHTSLSGAKFGAAAAVGLWAGDLVILAGSHARASQSQWLQSAGASLWVSVTSAIVLGAILGPIGAYVASAVAEVLRPKWSALWRGDGAAKRGFAAGLFTLAACIIGLSCIAYRANLAIGLELARPDTIAAATTAVQWLLVAALLPAWLAVNPLCLALVNRIQARPALRWLVHPVGLAGLMVSMALLCTVIVLRMLGIAAGALPWHYAFPWLGLMLSVAVVATTPRFVTVPRRSLAWAGATIGLLVLVASGIAAFAIRPESTRVRALAFEHSMSGRLGYAVWNAAFDFDGDGQIGILGGGDCAPFDPGRYAGALEIAGNGIDEDCDGSDLPKDPPRIRPRPSITASAKSLQPAGYQKIPSRPTVVFITIDALGAPRLVPLGSPVSLMPNLDAFAEKSVLFTHCFTQGPSTRLSFPSIFTSRYDSQLPFEPGVRLPHSWAPSERELQDIMDDAGYETVAIIPAEYFGQARWPSITRGFQHVDTAAIQAGKHDAPQVTDEALRWLSEDRERPLYLWIHYYDAHPPYIQIPGVSYKSYGDEPLYLAELQYIDRELGRLLTALEQRPEPTYVIVTADHSTVFHPNPTLHRAHYGYDLYAATLHVPLMVHGPELNPHKVDVLASTMDIAPTVADLLHWTDRADLQGTSLVQELLGGASQPGRALFHELFLPERMFHGYEGLELVSIQTERYNLVLNRAHGSYELYDWRSDYFEQNDLYEALADSPEIRDLRTRLAAFVQQTGTGRAATMSSDRLERWRAAEP